MSALRIISSIEEAAALGGPLHLAIGMFDGVHLGHQSVIEAAMHSAARSGGVAAVLSFWPHPSALVAPERRSRMMMSPAAKYTALARLGVGVLIEQAFTPEFARIPAQDFLPRLKGMLPKLATVYVGENWRFGAGRNGDVGLLLRSAVSLGVSVYSAPRVQFDGEPISSSRIRAALSSGDLTTVNALLGYSYFAEGLTRPGRQLGRTIGFPTLNLIWNPELPPSFGVYAVRVTDKSLLLAGTPDWRLGIANYGFRPTVGGSEFPLLETHVLGACPFDYGAEIVVEWCHFVRPEERFPDMQSLAAQIQRDVFTVREYFRLQGSP